MDPVLVFMAGVVTMVIVTVFAVARERSKSLRECEKLRRELRQEFRRGFSHGFEEAQPGFELPLGEGERK